MLPRGRPTAVLSAMLNHTAIDPSHAIPSTMLNHPTGKQVHQAKFDNVSVTVAADWPSMMRKSTPFSYSNHVVDL